MSNTFVVDVSMWGSFYGSFINCLKVMIRITFTNTYWQIYAGSIETETGTKCFHPTRGSFLPTQSNPTSIKPLQIINKSPWNTFFEASDWPQRGHIFIEKKRLRYCSTPTGSYVQSPYSVSIQILSIRDNFLMDHHGAIRRNLSN